MYFTSPHFDEECCPDFTKRVCFTCRSDIAHKLTFLAHNLAVAAALCVAWSDGWDSCVDCKWDGECWKPGCGRPRKSGDE